MSIMIGGDEAADVFGRSCLAKVPWDKGKRWAVSVAIFTWELSECQGFPLCYQNISVLHRDFANCHYDSAMLLSQEEILQAFPNFCFSSCW